MPPGCPKLQSTPMSIGHRSTAYLPCRHADIGAKVNFSNDSAREISLKRRVSCSTTIDEFSEWLFTTRRAILIKLKSLRVGVHSRNLTHGGMEILCFGLANVDIRYGCVWKWRNISMIIDSPFKDERQGVFVFALRAKLNNP